MSPPKPTGALPQHSQISQLPTGLWRTAHSDRRGSPGGHRAAAVGQFRRQERRLRDDRPKLGHGPGEPLAPDARLPPGRLAEPPPVGMARLRLSDRRAVADVWRVAGRLGPGRLGRVQCRGRGGAVSAGPPAPRANRRLGGRLRPRPVPGRDRRRPELHARNLAGVLHVGRGLLRRPLGCPDSRRRCVVDSRLAAKMGLSLVASVAALAGIALALLC